MDRAIVHGLFVFFIVVETTISSNIGHHTSYPLV